MPMHPSRRLFLAASAATLAGCASTRSRGPAIVRADRPAIPFGVASGDVTADSAIIWSRTDRPAKMLVEWSTTESFQEYENAFGPVATPATDFTAQCDLRSLPANQRIFYRVSFMSLADAKAVSEPVTGTFRTAPLAAHDLKFAWSADTVGQGWGINLESGGIRIYETIRSMSPDFFIHSGDNINADQPVEPEIRLPDGTVWKNLTTPAKSKVAETLDEFRGNYQYNLLDENIRRFNASIPVYSQWDDHEVHNNWYPGQILDDPAYKIERSIDVLAARARQAYLEHMPLRRCIEEPGRIYRNYSCGPLAELFILDERSYRGPNNQNRQKEMSPECAFLGRAQLNWLMRKLGESKATWKIIASDMPIGYVCGDGPGRYDGCANGDDGPPGGREFEIADLLSHCKRQAIRNLVFLTAALHHPSAVRYEPDRAAFKDFDPFWECVTGPLHAGAAGPNPLDKTFGPEIAWHLAPPYPSTGPAAGHAFFGMVTIDAKTGTLTVRQYDVNGREVHKIEVEARV
ncbi:MAG: alkaline phosphatase D family protein [Tepidisphaerales bacterium]